MNGTNKNLQIVSSNMIVLFYITRVKDSSAEVVHRFGRYTDKDG